MEPENQAYLFSEQAQVDISKHRIGLFQVSPLKYRVVEPGILRCVNGWYFYELVAVSERLKFKEAVMVLLERIEAKLDLPKVKTE